MPMESSSVSEQREVLKHELAFLFPFPSLSFPFILFLSFLVLGMGARVSQQAMEESRVSQHATEETFLFRKLTKATIEFPSEILNTNPEMVVFFPYHSEYFKRKYHENYRKCNYLPKY